MQIEMSRTCFNCGRSWGVGRSCQFCRQVEQLPAGVQLSSPAKRFGEYVVEMVLATVTLGIGWMIWSFVVYQYGQTPAKQLLGMRVVNLEDGAPATWGRMFVREFIAKTLVGILASVLLYLPYFWLILDKDNQELWDKIVGTVVVDDPNKLLDASDYKLPPAAQPQALSPEAEATVLLPVVERTAKPEE